MAANQSSNSKEYKDEINHAGRYILALNGAMTPAEVLVNGDRRVTFNTVQGDATIVLHLLPGDVVSVTGAWSNLMPAMYGSANAS